MLAAKPIAASRVSGPFLPWAMLGLFWMLFQAWVLGAWLLGPNFVAVEPGPDAISDGMKLFLLLCQILCPLAFLLCLWFWVVVPWRREGEVNSDVLIVLAASTVWFWDFSPSYVVDQVTYNSHMFNRGSWGLGSWPGWVSPGGNRVAEPLLFVPPAYIVLVLSQVMFVCAVLRKLKDRRPQTGVPVLVGTIILSLFFIDSVVETAFLRTGLYAYPTTVPAITLFAGQTYQFPLSEGFFFGGLGLGAIAILKFFKDDHGQTLVERGIDRLRYQKPAKKMISFFAIYGWIHSAFFFLYMIPAMFFALSGDHYPDNYPSYMRNGLCQYGEERSQCPGPGISIPRPQ